MGEVRETSLEAFMEEKDKTFISQEDRVLNYILKNPRCTDRDISKALSIEINAVNGRRNNLLKKNKIVAVDRIVSKHTGKKVLCWGCC